MRISLKRPAPSLSAVTAWFIAASAVVAVCLLYFAITERVRESQRKALQAAVITRANGIQAVLSRALYEDWRRLRHVTQTLDVSSPARARDQLDAIVGDGRRIAWAGYAGSDGIVRVASGGLLEGVDASRQLWFERGLDAPYAGDIHMAKLLALLLHRDDTETAYFMDLAIPVGAAEDVSGVLGMQINFNWTKQLLAEMARSLSVDVFLIRQDGAIVVATDGGNYADLNVASVRAARAGTRSSFLERWPDGKLYFAASVPAVAYADLPALGWKLVARIPADALFSDEKGISTSLIFYLVSFGAMLFLISAIFVQWFIRPFADLARSAQRVAEGKNVFPYESNRTSELRTIGAALVKLQLAAFGSSPPDGKS